MAVRTISTSIKLDGEQEFKKQMSSVNSELKTLKSEMALVTSEFKGQENSVDALTDKNRILRQQYDQQAEKVRALQQAVADSVEASVGASVAERFMAGTLSPFSGAAPPFRDTAMMTAALASSTSTAASSRSRSFLTSAARCRRSCSRRALRWLASRFSGMSPPPSIAFLW